jgi:hypothetical protein
MGVITQYGNSTMADNPARLYAGANFSGHQTVIASRYKPQ